jgi:hypothetical protein
MATNYVNYVASPEEPNLDEMRYALTQRNAVAAPSQQQRPLDGITDTFKRLAAEFNPLMLGRTLQDAPKILYNATVAPVTGTWAGALRNVQAAGAAQAYGALGMPQEAAAAQSRVQPVRPQDAQLQLRSGAGQQTQQALGEAFNALQLPPVGPGSGMPGTAPLTPRPILTPNDVRVMGAQAAHAVREARQIPTDVANVRGAGIQRMSPLTGQPSVGSRVGTAIEGTSQAAGRVGDIARDVGQSTADYMQMRRDMGLSPVPGVPPEFIPDLNMYAVRPTGTALTSPKVPETKNVADLSVGTAPQGAVIATGADKPRLNPSDALAYLTPMDMDPALATNANAAQIIDRRTLAFEDFMSNKAGEMYPDAPSARDAMQAFNAQFSRVSDQQRAELAMYDEFRDSPEGRAVGMQDLPSSTELQDRHAAAAQWLNSTFLNYVRRHLGAEGDPAVQLASQGLTMLPAADIRRLASAGNNQSAVEALRRKAGMPEQGTVAPAIDAKSQELADAQLAVIALETQRGQYRDFAMQQGLPDPAMLPEYAATTNPLQAAVAKRDKLQGELENLQLGKAYEDVSDLALAVNTPKELLRKIEYADRQFYPAVTRAQPDEKLYTSTATRMFGNTGLDQVASQFYDDVMRGNLPIEKLKGLTVEKYIRGKAEGRVAEEKRQAQAAVELKTNVESRMQQDMAQYVRPENYFGNVGVLELSTSTGFSRDEIRRLISDDTLVLDHCVAEGPTPGSKDKNLWRNNGERRYMPLVDPVTGQFRTDSPRHETRYIREASKPTDPGMLVSVRDKDTGLPVATLELQRSANGKYNIGYASGWQNGVVKKAYHDAIKEYLNSRASIINSGGSDIESNLGLIDLHRSNEAAQEAMRMLRIDRREATELLNAVADRGLLPRFGTTEDIRRVLAPAAQQPSAQQPVTTATAVLRDVNSAIDTAIAEAAYADPQVAELRRAFDGMLAERGLDAGEVSLPQLDGFIRTVEARRQNYLRQGSILVDALDNVMPALQGIRDQMSRGMYAQQPAAQQPAAQQPAAQQPDTQQGITAADLYNYLRDVAQAYGRDEGDAMLHAVRQVRQTFDGAPSYEDLLRLQPTAFAERIAEIAQQQNNAIVEQELLALADRIAPPVPPAQPANPFDRAVFPPDQQLANFDVHGMARDLLENARRDNQTFDTGDLGSSLFTLTHGNFDDFRFRALGADSAVAQRQVADALRQLIQAAGIQMPGLGANQPAAAQQQPIEFITDFRDYVDNLRGTLDVNAGEQFANAIATAVNDFGQNARISDLLRDQPTAFAERIAEIAVEWGYASVANELLELANRIAPPVPRAQQPEPAQPLNPLGAWENWEPDPGHPANQPGAAAAEPPANNFNPADFARNLIEDARLDNRHFDIQLLRNQAALLTDDPGSFMSIQALPLEQRNAAARRAQAELTNLMRPLEAQVAQRYTALQDAIDRGDVQELRAFRTAVGEADHIYWGALPAQERENVIRTLTAGIANLEQQPPANNPNIAPFRRIPADVRAMDSAALADRGMTPGQYEDMRNAFMQLRNNNGAAELRDIIQLVRAHTIGNWENFSPEQREYLARWLQNYIDSLAPPGYAKGGTVSQFPSLDGMRYELMMRRA